MRRRILVSAGGGGGGAKSLIFEGSGQIVEVHVPAQFVPAIDELQTRIEVLVAQGLEAETESVYRVNMKSQHASRTQIVGFQRASDGVPEFLLHGTASDANKLSMMYNNKQRGADLECTLYPSPPGLELALQNARQPAASAQTTRLISTQNPRPDSIHVITLGHPSDSAHSTDYSSNPLSEKVLIFEGAGLLTEFEIPEILFPILYTCVREGISQKKGESENTKPALDFHIIEGSINRVTRFALADEGIPHFLIVSAEKNLDAIKQMIAAPEPYTYRISSPAPVVPVQMASPAPAPVQRYVHLDSWGRDITEKGRYNNNGSSLDQHDVPAEEVSNAGITRIMVRKVFVTFPPRK